MRKDINSSKSLALASLWAGKANIQIAFDPNASGESSIEQAYNILVNDVLFGQEKSYTDALSSIANLVENNPVNVIELNEEQTKRLYAAAHSGEQGARVAISELENNVSDELELIVGTGEHEFFQLAVEVNNLTVDDSPVEFIDLPKRLLNSRTVVVGEGDWVLLLTGSHNLMKKMVIDAFLKSIKSYEPEFIEIVQAVNETSVDNELMQLQGFEGVLSAYFDANPQSLDEYYRWFLLNDPMD